MVRSQKIEISKKINKTIAVLSDIHYHAKYDKKRLEQIQKDLIIHQPDYICIVGDILDQGNALENEETKSRFFSWIESLAFLAPVIVSIGNHDICVEKPIIRYHYPKELLEEMSLISNVFVLHNTSFVKDGICFIGYNPPYDYYYQKPYEKVESYFDDIDLQLKSSLHPDCYQILLCHTPVYITNKMVQNTEVVKSVQLVLSGHMHSGLVPFTFGGNRGIISPFKKLFPKYARGRFVLEKTHYFISGGVITFSFVSPKYLHPFNCCFPISIAYLII